MSGSFHFEDGFLYEFRTRIGVVTIVCDTHEVPPLRVYGPDGRQIEPDAILECEAENTHGGFLAFDLTRFSKGVS